MSALASLPPICLFQMDDEEFAARRVIADAERRLRWERLLRWCSYVQARVVSISPALLDMAAVRRIDLARGCGRFRPPSRWSAARSDLPTGWEDVWPAAPGVQRLPNPLRRRRGRRAATVVRARTVPRGQPDGFFAVATDGGAPSGCARVGEADLPTHGGRLRVWFRGRLPETVKAAVVSMPVDRLTDHPVVTGRKYNVLGVMDVGFATVIEAETGLVPFAMPWADLARASGGDVL